MKIFIRKASQLANIQCVEFRLFLAVCIATAFSGTASAQLSGTYTVCSSGCDYNTIQKAAEDLKSQGIANSVVISIQPGIYNEQVTVGTISGVSSAKTVSFTGAGKKNTDVRVWYKSGTCWTIKEAEYITVENLQLEVQFWEQSTYAISIKSSSHINLLDCKLYAVVLNTYMYPYAPLHLSGNTDIRIKGCHLRGGGTSMDNGARNTNLIIEGNLITKFYHYGIYLGENTNTSYLNNTIDSSTNPYFSGALYTQWDSGTLIIRGNKILSGGSMGIYASSMRPGITCIIDSNFVSSSMKGIVAHSVGDGIVTVTRNRIRGGTDLGAGLYVSGTMDFSNNMIDMDPKANYGIQGYTYLPDAAWKIQHNTVYFNSATGYAMMLENKGAQKSITIKNNLLAGTAGMYNLKSLYKDSRVDGNVFTKSGGTLGIINDTSYTSMSALQSALYRLTGTGQNEQNASVKFVNAPSNLHLEPDSPAPYGINVGVLIDFDGDRRCDLFPTVGADENRIRNTPFLYLLGNDTIYSEVFEPIIEDSVYASDCSGTAAVTRSSTVDINVLGTYHIAYTAKDSAGHAVAKKRIVIIEDKTAPVLTLTGDTVMTVEVGSVFMEPGVDFSDNYYSQAKLIPLLVVKSNVDMSKVGEYTIEYSLTDSSGNGPVTVKRTVLVVDTQAPLLRLIGDSVYILDVNTTFNDPGITITDNYDKNLSAKDTIGTFYQVFPDGFADQLGTYTIEYRVEDFSGNKSTIKRTVIVQDTISPRLTLIGYDTVIICRWETYRDSGADIVENYSPSSEMTVVKEGNFLIYETKKAGVFQLRYKATDKSGNMGYSPWRTIIVLEPNTNGHCVTGIEEKGSLENNISVYPNPNSGRFTVKLNTSVAEPLQISITNALGQRVAEVDNIMQYTGSFELNLSAQPSGVYLVNVHTANKTITKKVIITR